MFQAFETEGVAARKGTRFLFLVVVGLETHTTFKYLLHFFKRIIKNY